MCNCHNMTRAEISMGFVIKTSIADQVSIPLAPIRCNIPATSPGSRKNISFKRQLVSGTMSVRKSVVRRCSHQKALLYLLSQILQTNLFKPSPSLSEVAHVSHARSTWCRWQGLHLAEEGPLLDVDQRLAKLDRSHVWSRGFCR